MSYEKEKKQMIYWAKALNEKGLVSAKNGNISYKVEDDKILITAHDAYLGRLEYEELLLIDLGGNILEGKTNITAEKNLHLSIHNKFKDIKVIFHAHSPYTIAFFHYFGKLDIFSFEAKFYLGDIKPIPQKTPAVMHVAPVLGILENSNLAVLKSHGVVSMGHSFKRAFSLIELLEEQAKVNLTIQSGQKLIRLHLSPLEDQEPKKEDIGKSKKEVKNKKEYKMLSWEHMQRLQDIINSDHEVQRLGKRYDLTCTLAVKNKDTGEAMCFHYNKGKIVKMDNSEDAEFVIIGNKDILRKVFNREVDPFVASTQGKVKTKGDFAKMSKWYPVMVRTFKLWEKAPVE